MNDLKVGMTLLYYQLAELPAGTAVSKTGPGAYTVTEVPAHPHDDLAWELYRAFLPGTNWSKLSDTPFPDRWRAVAEYVEREFTRKQKVATKLKDYQGDVWLLNADGDTYTMIDQSGDLCDEAGGCYRWTREKLDREYGPVTEVS